MYIVRNGVIVRKLMDNQVCHFRELFRAYGEFAHQTTREDLSCLCCLIDPRRLGILAGGKGEPSRRRFASASGESEPMALTLALVRALGIDVERID